MSAGVRAARHRFRLAVAIGVTILALIGAAIVAQRQRLPERQLARVLAERLGVPVAIGELSVGQDGAGFALRAQRLRIGPDGAPLLELRQVVVSSASLADVLDARIDEVRLQAPVLRLARDATGRLALPLPAGGEGGGRWPKMRIEDGRLLLDPSLGGAGELRLPRLTVTPAADGGLELAGEIEGSLSSPRALAVELRVAAHVDAERAALSRIAIDGMLADAAFGQARAIELRLGELQVSDDHAADGRGLALSARLQWPSGREIGLAASAAGMRLDASGLRLSPLALDLTGDVDGEPIRLASAASELRLSAEAVEAAGLQLDAKASRGPLAGRLSLQGEFRYKPSDGSATLTAQRLEASLAGAAGSPLGFDGRAGLAADLPQQTASGSIDGRLDGAPLQLALLYRAATEPPLQLIGRLSRIDLDRLGALGGDAESTAGGASGAMPAWPLVLDLRVDWLTRQELVLQGARLRYSPPPRRDGAPGDGR